MAKARLGSLRNQDEYKFWLSLFDELKSGVLADRIACPELEFQRDEAEFDKRIEHTVWEVISALSLGLEFRPYEAIIESQIEDAAFRFLGKSPPPRAPWSVAFKSDPQDPVESRMNRDVFGIKSRVDVHFFSPSKEVLEYDRQRKKRWEETAKQLLEQPVSSNWQEELSIQKSALVDKLIGPGILTVIAEQTASDSPLGKFIAAGIMSKLKKKLTRLEKIGITPQNLADFLKSGELLNTPYIDIFCSIDTEIVQNYRERTPRGSDLADAAIVATALPYSDVVTTDKFMKEILVNRLCLDKKYKCEVFSGTKKERVGFQELIASLK
jgi:hypothetical protein